MRILHALRDQIPILGATVAMVAILMLLGQLDLSSDLSGSPLTKLALEVTTGCAVFGLALRLLAPNLFRILLDFSSLPGRRRIQA